MHYNRLKALIASVVKQNDVKSITGENLQQTLLSMVDSLGANSTFAGIATPDTQPGEVDENVFYLANQPGVYVGFDSIEVANGELAVISNASGSWTAEKLSIGTGGGDSSIDEDLPVFDLEFSSAIATTSMPQPSGIPAAIYSYYIEAPTIRASEVEFDENNQAKIKVNINTDVFRTLQPIVAEVTKTAGFGITSYEQVGIDLDFNDVPVIWYSKFITFISGSISRIMGAQMSHAYRLKLSYDTPIILSSEDTTASHRQLIRCFGIRPCKFIKYFDGTTSSYDYIYNGQLTSKTYNVPATESNADPYAICLNSDNTLYKVAVTTDGLRTTTIELKTEPLSIDLTNDSVSTNAAGLLFAGISQPSLLTIVLNDKAYVCQAINTTVIDNSEKDVTITFGDEILYKYTIKVEPTGATIPVTYGGTVTDKQSVNLFELNSRLNALENTQA